MDLLGFSTGALARGDFEEGIRLQRLEGINAIELSALRETEVKPLVDALDDLDLKGFNYISFHAPSKLEAMSEDLLVSHLSRVAERGWPIVVHPDVVQNPASWECLGDAVLLENMDQRKATGRTADELSEYFHMLPSARFCFDIGHARQVDPTMSVAVELILEFGDRLTEIHLSEVSSDCRHIALSSSAVHAYQRVASLIPPTIPVILESMVSPEEIGREIEMSKRCFAVDPSMERRRHLIA